MMFEHFLLYLGAILRPLFYLVSHFRKKITIPPTENPILHTSASVLAAKIRFKKLTSEEVVFAFIERCRQIDPLVHAIIDERFDDALRDARSVDVFLQNDEMNVSQLEKIKPLLGLPVTIKEACKVKGMKFTNCIKNNAKRRANENNPAVELLLKAGAIPIATTSTPPYCAWIETRNELVGYTPNPFDTNKSVGGSSGGEAALLTCAASVIGLATDSGGSIPIPCSFTSLYGHRPSSEFIPCQQQLVAFASSEEMSNRFTVGPMCRYSEDIELFLNVLSEGRYVDTKHWPVDLKSLKIYYLEEMSSRNAPVKKIIQDRIISAVAYLRETFNCETERVDVNEIKEIIYVSRASDRKLFNDVMSQAHENFGDSILSRILVKMTQLFFSENETEKFEVYSEIKHRLKLRLQSVLSTNAVLLLPSFSDSTFYKYESYYQWLNTNYTKISSLLNLASTTIPAGLDENNMPIGIQILAAAGQDRLGIAVAKHLDKLFKGWIPPYKQEFK